MARFPSQKARDLTLSSKLEALRARNAAIDAVVYVDFGATTVLGASQSAGRPQEVLDGLCRLAANVFDEGRGPEQAVLMTVTEVLVLQHLPQEPGTALCFFFPPQTSYEDACGITHDATGSLAQ
ncbi:hypothetical protein SAMN04488094_106151 [Tropicimonas isoalkanivorans]|uniref:Uncharacterized protein n=1 Tax=Tropicimonas isoalkanivorans TaxID=441112 RepID=A0A1I1KJU3_9RHOB|nr:hypothetical protein SAMN04488094_106151 [Tropicimonas isoalkanivorans]